jgi:hypothetical protein
MPYKYGKKADGSTGWGKEETIISENLSGNASATENWLITTRGNDQIYYKTAGNGDRYYIDKSDSTGATTTWNEEDAMTVAEWDAASSPLEENQISSTLPPEPIGGDSLPPQKPFLAPPPEMDGGRGAPLPPAPLRRSVTPGGSEIKTYQVQVGVNPNNPLDWHPISTTEIAPAAPAARKRATRRGRRERSRRGKSRKVRR